ncbi:MAG: restriction endonuclease subunit S [Desulfobacteraceae bacterium]|nr:restriction endonuclease subunit S [Desulfobacteraceae bacterium]
MGSEWVESQLGDHCEILSAKRIFASDYVDNGIPFYRSKEIIEKAAGQNVSNQLFISEERFFDIKNKFGAPKNGDLLISAVGQRAGIPYHVSNDGDFYFKDGNLIWFRNFKESLFSNFLSYLLQSRLGQNKLEAIMIGSAQKALTIIGLKGVSFNIPSLPEQKAIAHVLGALDDRIELNRRMNETLESMAQALFKSWFVDFDPVIDNALAGGKEIPAELCEKAQARAALGDKRRPLPEEIRTLFPDEFTYSDELGWIPKGWVVSSVGKEFDVTMGQSPPGTTYNDNGEGIAFFQGRTDFGFRYPSNRIYCTAPKRFANKGDTLISVRAPVGDVNMAHIDCCIGRGVSAARHKSGSRSFTYYSMLEFRENFNKFEAEGTVFGSINQKDFKALLQLKNDKKLLEVFEVQAGALDGKIEQNSLAILNLTKLRDTLLPKLLSGELRIRDAEKMVEELAL